ncbi:MAG: Ig-like domain-containing protein, partial [Candidatus Izimaplasma sp.]|nr:Ig-like domain-containing protein [Candidatus Izimaplasma bacterium]
MKKLILLGLLLLIGLVITGCEKEVITLISNIDEITIVEGETYTLTLDTNDTSGLNYTVSDSSVASVSESGLIEAIAEGETTVIVTSKTDDSVTLEIDINVRKFITLTSEDDTLTMTTEDTHQLVIDSNADVTYQSNNTDILVVSETGLITAKEEGTATITVTSVYDPETQLAITVTIDKLIELSTDNDYYVMVVGDTETLSVTSNDNVSYQTSDSNVVTVDETGELTAIGFGEATIIVTSTYDNATSTNITVTVYKYTEEIIIEGPTNLVTGIETTYAITPSPVGAYEEVTWESSNEDILTVDETGLVTAVSAGSASLIAKSVLDDSIADTMTINVVDVMVIDASITATDTYDYNGIELVYGVNLFNDFVTAIQSATEGTRILVETGTYDDHFTITQDYIIIEGLTDSVNLTGQVTINANHITLDNLIFTSGAELNANNIEGLIVTNNTVVITSDLTDGAFMTLEDVVDVTVLNNSIDVGNNTAIVIDNLLAGTLLIKDNTIVSSNTGISLNTDTEYDITTEIKIMWNTIQADTLLQLDLEYGGNQKDIFAIARFNIFENYTIAVTANTNSMFDLTLNYWGDTAPDITDFTNVDSYYIEGYYTDKQAVLTETSYDPTLPIEITITNPIEEIMIGETHTFEYHILPLELQDAPIKFITTDPEVVMIDQTGKITPLTSGNVGIQVRSALVSSIRTQDDFSIITTPGIELIPSMIMNEIYVGDSFTLDYELFPYTIQDETATITTSNASIATIDSNGLVSTHAPGLVTFTATLDSDPTVSVDYTVDVHQTLDTTNLLDYLTTKQVTYSTIHKWVAYGFQYNYNDTRAESVSRYYFGDIAINDSKIVPVYYAIRPGEPMDPLPDGVTQYNNENIHWVVVHDTAST